MVEKEGRSHASLAVWQRLPPSMCVRGGMAAKWVCLRKSEPECLKDRDLCAAGRARGCQPQASFETRAYRLSGPFAAWQSAQSRIVGGFRSRIVGG